MHEYGALFFTVFLISNFFLLNTKGRLSWRQYITSCSCKGQNLDERVAGFQEIRILLHLLALLLQHGTLPLPSLFLRKLYFHHSLITDSNSITQFYLSDLLFARQKNPTFKEDLTFCSTVLKIWETHKNYLSAFQKQTPLSIEGLLKFFESFLVLPLLSLSPPRSFIIIYSLFIYLFF